MFGYYRVIHMPSGQTWNCRGHFVNEMHFYKCLDYWNKNSLYRHYSLDSATKEIVESHDFRDKHLDLI